MTEDEDLVVPAWFGRISFIQYFCAILRQDHPSAASYLRRFLHVLCDMRISEDEAEVLHVHTGLTVLPESIREMFRKIDRAPLTAVDFSILDFIESPSKAKMARCLALCGVDLPTIQGLAHHQKSGYLLERLVALKDEPSN